MATLNKNNSAVKRIMQEARELANDPCTDYSAAPLEDDIFEWHCTLRGPAATEFEGGLYHFRILLPAEYPFRPPSLMLLTPNGRFELNTKICISFTSYHEEMWQPAWGVRTAILGLQGFFPLKGQAALGVGSIEYPPSERKRLATLSRDWVCPHCQQTNLQCLPDPPASDGSQEAAKDSTPAQSSSSTPSSADLVVDKSNSSDSSPSSAITSSSMLIATDDTSLHSAGSPTQTHPNTLISSHASTGHSTLHVDDRRGAQTALRSSTRPPLLLDTAICVLLALVFALIGKRLL